MTCSIFIFIYLFVGAWLYHTCSLVPVVLVVLVMVMLVTCLVIIIIIRVWLQRITHKKTPFFLLNRTVSSLPGPNRSVCLPACLPACLSVCLLACQVLQSEPPSMGGWSVYRRRRWWWWWWWWWLQILYSVDNLWCLQCRQSGATPTTTTYTETIHPSRGG